MNTPSPTPSTSAVYFTDKLRVSHPGMPITYMLVAANVGLFVLMVFSGAGLWHTSTEIQLSWGANFGPATKDGQWWRLCSAMFLHFGLIHLTLNMLALWDAGRLVERMYGSGKFALIYFIAGLAGNLLSLVVRGEHAISGGASGAILGIYGALLVGLWWQRRVLHAREFRWMFWGGACFAIAMIGIGMVLPMLDNAAHIGGFSAGIVAAIIVFRPMSGAGDIPRHLRLAALCLLLSAVITLIVIIPAPRYRWSDEINARNEINEYLRDDMAIANSWRNLMNRQQTDALSFNQLAGKIESDVADRYEDSFEQISQVTLNPSAPSAAKLATVRRYAELRRDSARTMVEGLRTRDGKKIDAAVQFAKQAEKISRGTGNAPTGMVSQTPGTAK